MDEEHIKREFEKIWNKFEELERKFIGSPIKQESSNIDSIWDLDGDVINLLRTVGEDNREKTKNAALLTLLGYKRKLGKEKILASELRRNIGMNKIPLENFGTHLNELIPQSILRIGKFGSKKTEYKLTHYGEALAKEVLGKIEL